MILTMKLSLFVVLLLTATLPCTAQFTGKVFIDNNQSGKFDDGDFTLSKVAVTDGKNVVLTNGDGTFTLPGYEKSRFITITTPAGYQAKKYFIPITEQTDNYDFILYSDNTSASPDHTFLHITDTEVMGGVGRWSTDLYRYVINEKPSFIIHTGDICYEPGLSMHQAVVNTQNMGCPVYYTIGNHDLVRGEYGEELFESIYGPVCYSFDVGNIHYVVTPIKGGDQTPSYTRKEIYDWLINDLSMLKEGQSVILFNHDIFTTESPFVYDAGKGHKLDLTQYNTLAQVYGHWHYNYVRKQGKVYTICTNALDKGGIDHSASCFREIKVDQDNNISTQLRYTFVSPRAVIVSPMNGGCFNSLDGSITVSVNAYNSFAKTSQVDYVIKAVDTNKVIFIGKLSQQTDWNWAAKFKLPGLYNNKELKLEVVSHFNGGEVAHAESIFTFSPVSSMGLSQANEWNTLLNNASHTGNINESDLKLPLSLKWVANAGNNIFMSSPLIANDKIYVATIDDNTSLNASVSAFDISTGALVWQFPTFNSVKNTMAHSNGIIAVQDAACNLYAIDANSGKLMWQDNIYPDGFPYLAEGLTIHDGTLYAGTGKGLAAYDIRTGMKRWQNSEWRKNEGATTTLTVAGNALISGTQWGGLYANDIRDGKLLWKLTEKGLSNRGASPVYKDGALWIISAKSFFMIEPMTGKILQHKEIPANVDVTSTPLVTDNEIIFGTADKGVMALDKKSLYNKWIYETQPSLVYTAPYATAPMASIETSPVSSNGNLYIGASDGYLYVIDQSNGLLRAKWNLGAPIFSTVALTDGILIVADYSGNVYCFNSKD